jgi:hypothetical protein
MGFEEQINDLNELYFYREFTFAKTTFRPSPKEELELADSVVWLDDLLILFQLKEREVAGETTEEAEAKWFEKKVLGLATRQIRDTMRYLDENSSITITNQRGHEFQLDRVSIATEHRVVSYREHPMLPTKNLQQKCHVSETAGFIHLIAASDYLQIVQTLRTPSEVSEYLAFREAIVTASSDAVELLPEEALLGQFLSGELEASPDEDYLEYVSTLEKESHEWDMSRVIEVFQDRLTVSDGGLDYYPMVREVAKLNRVGLKHFKERFRLALDKTRDDQFARPYRFVDLRTQCGFVFVPFIKASAHLWEEALKKCTWVHKYDQRLRKCVGVSFTLDEQRYFDINWCYIEYDWVYDADLENALAEKGNPLREVQQTGGDRYSFDTEE